MEDISFTVNISSEDCKDLFPDNSMSNFKVRLAKQLNLHNGWRVSLAEIVFTNALYTFNTDETVYLSSDYMPGQKPVFDVAVKIKPNLYESISQLVETINNAIKKKIKIRKAPVLVVHDGDRIEVKSGETLIKGARTNVNLSFSNTLKNILGVDRWGKAFLDARQSSIFVYSNICSPRIVGDVSVPLLKQVSSIAGSKKRFGSRLSHIIQNELLCTLSQHHINTIEIQLLDDTGKPPQFKYGTVELVFKFHCLHGE